MRHDGPVTTEQPRPVYLLLPLLVLGVVVALVSTGFGYGFWLANLHNGLLALAFGGVATWTLLVRSNQREALLFAAVGVLEGFLFLGRQVAHEGTGTWWGWFGVWPLALILATITWAVLCFPEGQFLSRGWHRVGIAIARHCRRVLLALGRLARRVRRSGRAYGAPVRPRRRGGGSRIWNAVAHPAYALFQLVWVVGVLARWRRANGVLRNQLALLGVAVGISTAALLVGLAVWQSPRAGLLTTPLVPVTAGWIMARLSLGRVIEEARASGGLASLSPRENEVLDLMAQGLSNRAISEQLHLSIKTVEPVVSSIFTKLRLPADSDTNRRVLAVLALLEK